MSSPVEYGCFHRPLYEGETPIDNILGAAGGLAGFLAGTLGKSPLGAVLGGMSYAFGVGAAVAASGGNPFSDDFDWSGFTRSMSILNYSGLVALGLSPTYPGIANALSKKAVYEELSESSAAGLASAISAGVGAITGELMDEVFDKNCDDWYANSLERVARRSSPLIIDMDKDSAADLIAYDEALIYFDLDLIHDFYVSGEYNNDDYFERTGWLNPQDGFLALPGSNGTVDGLHELFGADPVQLTYQRDALGLPRDGFEELALHDTNVSGGDGVIDQQDAVFDDLVVWQDMNSNGYSEAGETRTLSEVGITKIHLTVGEYDMMIDGQRLDGVSVVEYADGSTSSMWDVWFERSIVKTAYMADEGYDPDVYALPQLHGYGQMKDLWRAMTDDPDLLQDVVDFANALTTNLAASRTDFEELLYKWIGVEWAGPYATGTMDGRAEEAMAYIGNQTYGEGIAEGWSDHFQGKWDGFVNTMLVKFAAQLPSSSMVNATYLALEHLTDVQAAGDLAAMSPQDIYDEVEPYFTAGANVAENHALASLELDYDAYSDIIIGSLTDMIESMVANDPGGASQQTYWNNQLLLLDAVGRSYGGIYGNAAPVATRLVGSNSSQTLTGTASHNILFGQGGNDTLNAGDGDDILFGGTGNDLLNGGGDNNTYYWNAGFGHDTVYDQDYGSAIYEASHLILGDAADPRQLSVAISGNDLILTHQSTGETLTVKNQFDADEYSYIKAILFADGTYWNHSAIENVALGTLATQGADQIGGGTPLLNFRNNILHGLGGNDTLSGGVGDDMLLGDEGNDWLEGEWAYDTLDGGAGRDTLTGGHGADVFTFSDLAHSVETSSQYDRITDFDIGMDKIDLRGLGFRKLVSGTTQAGELRLIYSSGSNRTYVRSDQSDFEFYLDGNYTQGANKLTNVDFIFGVDTQTLQGTAANDSLTGVSTFEFLSGLAGNDTLSGGIGSDTLDGGAGKDTLTGGFGGDVFKFTALTHSVHAGGVYDRITDFEKEVDVLDVSGLGFTTLTSSGSTQAGELRLVYSSGTNRTYVRSDQSDFEFYLDGNYTQGTNKLTNLDFIFYDHSRPPVKILGTAAADTLTGTPINERLLGWQGEDTLAGGVGDDVLSGGAGKDKLTGGSGADSFRFVDLTHSVSTGGQYDRIVDFEVGIDTIDLRGLGFTTLTGSGSTQAGELRLIYNSGTNRTHVHSDQVDFEFYLDGNYTQGANKLTNADFLFTEPDIYITLHGTGAADTRTGNGASEALFGLAGTDSLDGGSGHDLLDGGAGKDKLTGGAGADTFRFTDLAHSVSTGGQYDRLMDFAVGTDTVDLSELIFSTLTSNATTQAGELRLIYSSGTNRTYVHSDQVDFEFYLEGNYTQGANQLTNEDFMFA